MKVGTIEILESEKENKPRRNFPGGGKPGGGDQNNGGGSDGGNLSRNDFPQIESYQPDKSQVFMWFLLIVVFMTFGGLISAYIVVSTNGVIEWKPFDFSLPFLIQLCFSTFLIFASSLTYHRAQRYITKNDQPQAKKWLIVTTVLGAIFISSQIIVWFGLVRRGVYVYGNPYAGFFYILTVVHAVHVLGGIAALGSIVLRLWNTRADEVELKRRIIRAQVVGWYWHLMGALWFCLFLLLGFWK